MRLLLIIACVITTLVGRTFALDWPAHRGSIQRNSTTDETLSFPMQKVWIYRSAQAPRPAWPEPPRLLNKLDFDYAAAPAIANGILYFGSSADDTIRALDANTGELKWRFTTGGPVRFAPQIYKGKLYATSDDGIVYCLDAATGTKVWTFTAAPEPDMYVGNRRMISRWPIRTGVLVDDDVAYTIAGVWPSEGIYAYALNAQTGEIIWVNDNSSIPATRVWARWRPHDPHAGEFTWAGLTPQGILTATKRLIIVPLSNNSSTAFSRKTGALSGFAGLGSGNATTFMDGEFQYKMNWNRQGLLLFGAHMPPIKGQKRKRAVNFKGDQLPQVSDAGSRHPFEKHATGFITALVRNGKVYARRAYGMVLSADTMLVGDDDAILALKAETQEEIWRAPVDGEPREIAVANGRIYVSTTSGEITCFTPQAGAMAIGARPVIHDRSVLAKPTALAGKYKGLIHSIRRSNMDHGFALLLDDNDGALALAVAAGTDLNIISAVGGQVQADALRDQFLNTTALYGSRIHVFAMDGDRLPFAQYFANVVIVTGSSTTIPTEELYRVLRPYGGIMLFPDMELRKAALLARQITAEKTEYRLLKSAGRLKIVRGELKGARNWNSQVPSDKLVKWPLRPIWFGGPDPVNVMNIGIGAHPPVAASGVYYVTGNDVLTAVDAFNGTEIWSRIIPTAVPNRHEDHGLRYLIVGGMKSHTVQQFSTLKRLIDADDKNVYLRLGKDYFKGKAEAVIQVDAMTGEQKQIAGPWIPSKAVSLSKPQRWNVKIDEEHSGTLTLARDGSDLIINLTTKDPIQTDADCWDLFFDFRPTQKRYGLYGKGTFMVRVYPSREGKTAYSRPMTGVAHPNMNISGKKLADHTETQVRISFDEVKRLFSTKVGSFGFAATLVSFDGEILKKFGGRKPFERWQSWVSHAYLFSDAISPSMNIGWATIMLDAAPPQKPNIFSGSADALPNGWLLAVITGAHDDYVGSRGEMDESIIGSTRIHPLTGQPGPKIFRSGSSGCGRPVFSASSIIGRTTKLALGFYDFLDDSGLHFFPGIAANCGARMKAVNMTASLGLLIFSESRSHCDCMVPIRTSMAFAPAEKRLNEDWAMFADHNADQDIRQAYINFSALGDRRDDDGHLWLNYPRTPGGKAYPRAPGSTRYVFDSPPISATLQLPIQWNRDKKVAPYVRINSDRRHIENTSIPWVYGSQLRGPLDLTFRVTPVSPLIALKATVPVTVDGHFKETAWGKEEELNDKMDNIGVIKLDEPEVSLKFSSTAVLLRYDDSALYFAARRSLPPGRRGEPAEWVAKTSGKDAAVHKDDSLEVFLTDSSGKNILHLGVSISGATYDALSREGQPEKVAWNGEWQAAATREMNNADIEIAVPWSTIAAAGIDKNTLGLNLLVNRMDIRSELIAYPGTHGQPGKLDTGIADPLLSLGGEGRALCANFVPLGLGQPPVANPRSFTVRMHFAELDAGVAAGMRVFDVKMQEKIVLKDFDVVSEAGGPNKAIVKEFRHVMASEKITIEFIPKAPRPTNLTAAIISGLEILDESFIARTHSSQ